MWNAFWGLRHVQLIPQDRVCETFNTVLLRRPLEPGQYASRAYGSRLAAHGIRGSMSRRGNPYDNAHVESFFKTLKHEEIFANDYSTIDDLTNRLPHFLEEVYNRRRLHSSLGYRPPEEFESVSSLKPSTGQSSQPPLSTLGGSLHPWRNICPVGEGCPTIKTCSPPPTECLRQGPHHPAPGHFGAEGGTRVVGYRRKVAP